MTRSGDHERAFGLVEILVVLVIVAILSAFAVSSLRSSRSTGGRLELAAAATRYADAVERYQTDHGRRVPALGTADWPWARVTEGPLKRIQIGGTVERPYLKGGPPEIMERVGPVGAAFVRGSAPRSRGGTLVYSTTGNYSFRIQVFWDGQLQCTAGDIPVGARVNRCSAM